MSNVTRPEPDAIGRLEFDVDFPPGHAAAYLVPDEQPLLVDAGTLGSAGSEELAAGLAECGYEPADVGHVLLTHPHVDHVGQVAHLREVAEPTIHAPRPFEEYLRRDVEDLVAASRGNLREAGVDGTLIDSILPEFRKSEAIVRDVLPVSAVDHWLEPGESAAVGPLTVDPIHAPGHHEPHVCYATDLGSRRVMFSGDMLIEPFRAMTIHAGFDDGVEDGVEAFQTALSRLQAASIDCVFPGHGPVHEAYAATIDRSVTDLETRLSTCASALGPAGKTPLDVASDVSSADRDGAMLLPEVVGVLAALERQGRADSRVEDGVRYYEPA